jgi:putative hydrolase of the HAD superfamily
VTITFLWFDLGYTLLYKPREQAYQRVMAELGHSFTLEELERQYHLMDKHFMREHPGVFGHDPETFMPWFLGELNHRLGIRTDLARTWARLKELQRTDHDLWLPFEHVSGALVDLRRRSYRLGVITNWDPSARPLLEAHGLAGFFEQVLVSCEVGVEKPDPRIFTIAAERAGVAPGECLYIGDNYYVDTVGARQAGMECLIVNRFGSLGVEELRGQPIVRDISEVAAWLEARRPPHAAETREPN